MGKVSILSYAYYCSPLEFVNWYRSLKNIFKKKTLIKGLPKPYICGVASQINSLFCFICKSLSLLNNINKKAPTCTTITVESWFRIQAFVFSFQSVKKMTSTKLATNRTTEDTSISNLVLICGLKIDFNINKIEELWTSKQVSFVQSPIRSSQYKNENPGVLRLAFSSHTCMCPFLYKYNSLFFASIWCLTCTWCLVSRSQSHVSLIELLLRCDSHPGQGLF